MRSILIPLFTILLCSRISCQNSTNVPKTMEVYTTVDQPAEFPGGTAAMMKYVSNNIQFPKRCLEDSSFAGCKVFVKFVVYEDGSLNNPVIVKGCPDFPECDKEVIRVVKSMPPWKPAKKEDRTVKTYYMLPVSFRIR